MVSEWSVGSVGDFFDLVTGYTFKSSDFFDYGIPVIKITNVKAGYFSKHQFSYVSPDFLDTISEKIALTDDLLISMSGNRHDGSPETWVGKVALFREEDTYLINQRVGILRLKRTDGLDARFASFLLSSYGYQQLFIAIATSSGGQANLSSKQILDAPIRYPEISEQRAIAHILGTLDDKIELNRRINETLEEMARALFKSWFVDFDPVRAKMEGRDPGLPKHLADLFPDRLVDSELGLIPEGWEVKALEECLDVAKGLSYKGAGLSSDGVPMHNLNSIYEGGGYKDDGIKYYNSDYQPRHVIQSGEVIVANTEQGHDRLLIGFAAIVPKRFGDNGLFSHHIYRVRPKGSFALTPDFICQLLNTRVMHSTVSGYANGTTVNMLPADALRIPLIVIPPPQIMTMFSTIAEAARIRQEKFIVDSQTLIALRDALLPKLVSGDLRIKQTKMVTK